MAKHYVTFGQVHVHSINGHTLDKDCVACYKAETPEEGREKAFDYFGDQFFTDYHLDEFPLSELEWFPRGIIEIE